jgi:hypothetical protein
LEHKGVKTFGDLREFRGALVLPLRDLNGELHSLQFIGIDGSKKFLTGSRIAGCFFTISDKSDGALAICEGYATGASIHEATGLATISVTNCGNLLAVAKALRERFPSRQIIIAADNDAWTDGNPGLTKATEAAKAIGANLATPHFKDVTAKPTDFNDMAALAGLPEVKRQIEAAARVKEITAKHCLSNKETGKLFDGLLMKMGMPNGAKPRYVKIPLKHDDPKNYWTSPSGLDLAAIPLPSGLLAGSDGATFKEDQIVTPQNTTALNIVPGLIVEMVCVQPEYEDPIDFAMPETLPTTRYGHLSRLGFIQFENQTFIRPHVVDIHNVLTTSDYRGTQYIDILLLKWLEQFVNLEHIWSYLANIDKGSLDKRQQHVIKLFEQGLENKKRGESYDQIGNQNRMFPPRED